MSNAILVVVGIIMVVIILAFAYLIYTSSTVKVEVGNKTISVDGSEIKDKITSAKNISVQVR